MAQNALAPRSSNAFVTRWENASPLEREVYQQTGMEPGLKRKNIIPTYDSKTGVTLPQWAYDAALTIVGPAAAAKGIPISQDEVLNTAANIATSAFAGGAASSLVGKPIQGNVGMFLGPQAKSANLTKLNEAKKLLAEGKSPAAVWKQTGWGKGPDGNWRFEISDADAIYNARKIGSQTLKDVTPDTHYNKYVDAIALRRHAKAENVSMKEAEEWFEQKYGRKPIWSAAVHAKNDVATLYDKIYESGGVAKVGEVFEHPELFKSYSDIPEISFSAPQSYADTATRESYSKLSGLELRPDIAANPQSGKSRILHGIQHYIQDTEGFSPGSSPWHGDYDWYYRLPGEAEARLTQARMNLTKSQRAEQYPWDPNYFAHATGVNINNLSSFK